MKLNMKIIFIVNESAGRGKSKKIIPNIEKECKNQNIEFEIRYITKEKSGYDIAFEYKDKEYYNTNKSTIQCKHRIYFHKVQT